MSVQVTPLRWSLLLLLLLSVVLTAPCKLEAQNKQAAHIGFLTTPAERGGVANQNRQWRNLKPLVVPDDMKIEEPLAWKRDDQYLPPDFESFFPDDPEGGRVLDDLFSGKMGGHHDPGELLAAVRWGLRNTRVYTSQILAQIGNGFVWGVENQDPRAIELLYHASDVNSPVCHEGMYYGLCVLNERTPNVMRAVSQGFTGYGREIQGRIIWGLNQYGDHSKSKAVLEAVLSNPDGLDENGIVSALDLYEKFTGSPFPEADRLRDVGKFVVGFRDRRAANQDPLRRQMQEWAGNSLLNFVERIDGGQPVGVALIKGIATREAVVHRIDSSPHHELVFAETFAPVVLQSRQLREFADSLPGGLPRGARPNYAPLPKSESFAWNHPGRYQPPEFSRYFPDDPVAARQLDQLYENRESTELTAREQLELVRKGLRRSENRPAWVLAWVSTISGWPEDPMAKEIFYHAADPNAPQNLRYNAIYFGLRGWWKKPPNILKLFAEIILSEPYDHSLGSGTVGSITWSLRDPEEKRYVAELVEKELEQPDRFSTEKLANLTTVFEGLAGRKPASFDQYKSRGFYGVGFRHKRLNDSQQVKSFAESFFHNDPFFVKAWGLPGEDPSAMLVIVRGIDGANRAVEKLQQSGRVSIDLAVPMATFKLADPDKFPLDELKPFFE